MAIDVDIVTCGTINDAVELAKLMATVDQEACFDFNEIPVQVRYDSNVGDVVALYFANFGRIRLQHELDAARKQVVERRKSAGSELEPLLIELVQLLKEGTQE